MFVIVIAFNLIHLNFKKHFRLEKKVGNIKQSDLIFDLQDIFTAHKVSFFK